MKCPFCGSTDLEDVTNSMVTEFKCGQCGVILAEYEFGFSSHSDDSEAAEGTGMSDQSDAERRILERWPLARDIRAAGRCDACHAREALYSFVLHDNHDPREGHESCGYVCMACDWSNAGARLVEAVKVCAYCESDEVVLMTDVLFDGDIVGEGRMKTYECLICGRFSYELGEGDE